MNVVPSLVVVIPSMSGLVHRSVAEDGGIISLTPVLSIPVGGVTFSLGPYKD